MSVPRYSEYDAFAWVYRLGWGADYHREARAALATLIFPRLPKGARILDLCCGTGDLTETLVAEGYQVTGLEGSEEMLCIARSRFPDCEFVLEDARQFRLPASFDAVLSTFDSLNHLLNVSDLEAALANAHRALAPGGRMVFDLNMEEAFQLLWRGTFATVEETAVCVTRCSYDEAARLGRAELTMFRLETAWQRSDVNVLERCYSADEVTAALRRTGFANIETRDAHELGMRGDVAVGRTFFSAVKPMGANGPSPAAPPDTVQ